MILGLFRIFIVLAIGFALLIGEAQTQTTNATQPVTDPVEGPSNYLSFKPASWCF